MLYTLSHQILLDFVNKLLKLMQVEVELLINEEEAQIITLLHKASKEIDKSSRYLQSDANPSINMIATVKEFLIDA